MKREFIKSVFPDITKEVLDQIMDEHDKDVTAKTNIITQLTTERDGLKTQLDTATTAIKSYEGMDVEGIKTAAKEWETKYNTETKSLQEQLDTTTYGFAVKEATAGLRFTSESARKAFVADLTVKKLPLQEGKLLGLEDFRKGYQESDPGAFVPENDDKTPLATRGGTGGGTTMGADAAMRAAMGLPEKKE